jgi:hypothetical protein
MLYGLSNILKRETREREESTTADQEGATLDLSDEIALMALSGNDSAGKLRIREFGDITRRSLA